MRDRTPPAGTTDRSPARHFAIGLARAFGGALIFGLPLLMTMEMWQLGFSIAPARLALLVALTLPLLVGLSHVGGFEETFDVGEDVVDAFVAWAVGTVVSAAVLLLLGLLGRESTLREAIGMVSLQAVPASIGALLAQSQLGGRPDAGDASDAGDGGPSSYGAELFLMLAGALFLALNIAPTEEMIVIAYRATPWHALALVVVSLGLMHAFVYAVEFRGQHARAADETHAELFVRFTVAGYAIALLASAYVLWTFGRLDDTSWGERVTTTLVLGFPAAIGAAAARLLL